MSSPSKPRVAPWLLILAAAALGCTNTATAQSSDAPQARSGPRNLFDIGHWWVTHQHTARYGTLSEFTPSTGLTGPAAGDTFSMEDDLGLAKRGTATSLAYTRLIGVGWHISADYIVASRQGTAVTTRALKISGSTLPAGSTVVAENRTSLTALAGGLALVQRGDTEFGVRIGGGFLRDGLSYDVVDSSDDFAPGSGDLLPLLGLFFSARPTDTLQFDARLDHMRGGSSRNTQLRAALRWHPNPHVGLELAYWRMNGRSTGDDDIYANYQDVKYTLSGPRVALRLAF